MIFLITETLEILPPDHREDSGMDKELAGESLPQLWRSLYSEEKEKVIKEEAEARLWVECLCFRENFFTYSSSSKLLPLL